MSASSDRILEREVEATIIPAGDKVNLPAGSKVTITHRLGGNFTVTSDWGMFRIKGVDADVLGEEIPDEIQNLGGKMGNAHLSKGEKSHNGPPDHCIIWEKLKSVYDPEIPVNIVDLGLVYTMDVKEDSGEYGVYVAMTLTAPGCGMGPSIAADAKERLLTVPGVSDANVEIVWDPPWSQDMLSEEGKMELGLI